MAEILITPTSELEAINLLLGSIGESPVATLDNAYVDAQTARNVLTAESRALQAKGWRWNTEKDYVLVPTDEGEIILPSNALMVLQDDDDIVQRGARLYNRSEHSYTCFTESLTVQLVVGLGFDELPEAARAYLAIRGGRVFQDRMGSDRVIHAFQERDELTAKADLLNYEALTGRANAFRNDPLVQRLTGARN